MMLRGPLYGKRSSGHQLVVFLFAQPVTENALVLNERMLAHSCWVQSEVLKRVYLDCF